METLFGAESDDSEDEEPEALGRPDTAYSDDEAEGGVQGAESEGERAGSELDKEESEAERNESEAEREESDVEHGYDDDGQVGQKKWFPANERMRGRHQISASGSEQSHEGHGLEEEEDEVEGQEDEIEQKDDIEQAHELSEEGDDGRASGEVAGMRDVFGDSDEEEQEIDNQQQSPEVHKELSPSDDEVHLQRDIRPEDIVHDEEEREELYDSEDERQAEHKAREKPVGPPLHIEVPLRPPPGNPDKMHVVRVSNIMGIESKPFDPKTYTEEEFLMDESGDKRRLRLEDNVARWRLAKNRDGSISYESNARFVKWSDGSMQLLIGNEVLDLSIQKAHQDQAHLFLRHSKAILQSQGRLLQKMKFMPSSLSSKSHKLLTALVDSRNRKIYKVKNVITNKDPEREKEETEKLEEQRIRSKEDLQRKQDKISRKYVPARERVEPQLSPGYLEGALEEEEETDDYGEGQRFADARRFQEQLEAEGKAEKKIINAKRPSVPSKESLVKRQKDRRPSPPSRRELEDRFSEESEREASDYESDGQEDDAGLNEGEEDDQDEEGADHEEEDDDQGEEKRWEDGEDETNKKRRDRGDDFENDESPPRKPVQRRRVVVSDSEEED